MAMKPLSVRYSTALVTGASSGLGRAMARWLVSEGVQVLGLARHPEAAAHEDGWQPVACDLAAPAALEQFLTGYKEWLGHCPLLINNAGAGVFGSLEQIPPMTVRSQLHVLLEAPVLLCQAVLPGMKNRCHGAIVNVSSMAVRFPLPFMSLYDAAKGGLSGFSRGLQWELRGSGVAVLDLRPGDFRTGFNRRMQAESATWHGTPGSSASASVWNRLESNLQAGPPPECVVRTVQRWLQSDPPRSTTLAAGGFFQTRLAPLLATIAPGPIERCCISRYFGLK